MASSQSTERPMGSMVAAVSETSTPSSSAESRRLPSPHSSLPLPSSVAAPERSSFATNWHPDNHPVAEGDPSRPFISSLQPRRDYQLARQHSTYLENDIRDKFLTSFQNVHMRSSPPIQPNEHGYADKLPSFSEFLDTTRANTPPLTPSRRQGSTDSLPHDARPQFDDVAWQDKGHRRIDTLGDIYANPSHAHAVKQLPQEQRRISSTVDALIPSRHSPAYALGPSQQHRPSYSYPPPHAPAPYGAQVRQHSSPAPPQPVYRHSPAHPGLAAHGAYPPPAPNAPVLGHRPSYYQDPHAATQSYAYDAAQDAYYGRPSYSGQAHAGYENGYSEVRFQQHVGIDPNAFSRKRRGNLPKDATNVLKMWFQNHRAQPYPTEDQKIELCQMTGLTMNQVSNWFINARRRAPLKEAREREANGSQPEQL